MELYQSQTRRHMIFLFLLYFFCHAFFYFYIQLVFSKEDRQAGHQVLVDADKPRSVTKTQMQVPNYGLKI